MVGEVGLEMIGGMRGEMTVDLGREIEQEGGDRFHPLSRSILLPHGGRPAMPPPRMHGGPSYPRTSEKAEHSFSYSPLPGVGKGQSRGMERRESTPGLEVTVVIVVGLW